MTHIDTTIITTKRLSIKVLVPEDHAFIAEIVNSPSWLEFISDGKGKSSEEVIAYIARIINNPECTYWVLRLHDSTTINVITFMKRDYLNHYDIGFALLTRFCGMGYADEATRAVLQMLASTGDYSHIQATTLPANTSSIRLLEKLGFEFVEEFQRDDVLLLVYSISMETFFNAESQRTQRL